jgi:hypothetical protein
VQKEETKTDGSRSSWSCWSYNRLLAKLAKKDVRRLKQLRHNQPQQTSKTSTSLASLPLVPRPHPQNQRPTAADAQRGYRFLLGRRTGRQRAGLASVPRVTIDLVRVSDAVRDWEDCEVKLPFFKAKLYLKNTEFEICLLVDSLDASKAEAMVSKIRSICPCIPIENN